MAPRKRKAPGCQIAANPRGRRTKITGSESTPVYPASWIPSFSRATLGGYEDERTHLNKYSDLNRQNPGNSKETWGTTRTGALASIKKKGKAPRVHNHFTGFDSLASLFRNASDEEPTTDVPNGPDTSPLIGLPLEVRENIYGFLLSETTPVVVEPDWETLQGRVRRNKNLQYVCKQLADESSKFLYTHNVFLAMLRRTRRLYGVEDIPPIYPKFISLFRNVVIHCPMDKWNMDWHLTAASAVNKLANAGSFLTSLTIVVCPSRGKGTSSTALGLEANPLHFADFFYFSGPLMTSIRRLRCKVLNIIVKKRVVEPDSDLGTKSEIKRFLISVDLTYLHSGELQHGPLANENTITITRERVTALESELQGLKDRVEYVFENCDSGSRDNKGLYRELAPGEETTDGMALAKRK